MIKSETYFQQYVNMRNTHINTKCVTKLAQFYFV